MRNFILSLPSLNSYCNCLKLCTKVEIEHVYPKSLLRAKLTSERFSVANRDPHNLFPCCSYLNRKKADSLLGKNYDAGDVNGILARACLYMDDSYELQTERALVQKWKEFSELYPPYEFEYTRNAIIKRYNGSWNKFID